MAGFDYEGGLIASVVQSGDIVPALEARVLPSWFVDEQHREVWTHIANHFREYGEVPSEQVIRYDFPDYGLVEPDSSMVVYVDRIADRRRNNLLGEALAEAASELENGDSALASDILARGLTRVYTEVSTLRDVNLTESWLERLEKYEWYSENRGKLLGIPMGVRTIDEALAGFQPEQLITFAGKQKSGKSYMLMHAAITAHRNGSTVLFVSFEMSNDEQAARHDALISQVDHSALIRGESTEAMRDKVQKALKRRKNMQPFVLSADPSGGNTLSSVAAKIEQYQPDIVFVDGVYLMQDEEGGKDERQQLTNITRGFKRMAQRTRLPIIITTQALEWKIGRRGLQTSSLGYTSSFGQDSDALIGFESIDEEDDPGLKRVKILDARNAPRVSTLVRWDFQEGTMTELEDDEHAEWDELMEEME